MIDSHAHLTSPQILPIVDAVIERAKQAGVEKIINICTDKESLEQGIKLRDRHKEVFNTAATTPHDVDKEGESFFTRVEKYAKDLVAIGETGLDYFYEHSPRTIQQQFLIRYFEFAKKVKLPVVLHCRDAFEDLFSIADEVYGESQAVLHCFTGTLAEAKKCLDRGWVISFSGIITYKKSLELCDVVKYVPLDRIFIETDSPYLAPQSMRGKQNEPAFIKETAEKIGQLKEVSFEEVDRMTSQNIKKFFNLH
jgi:TatD DNase family protein